MKEVSIDVESGEKSTRDFTEQEIQQVKQTTDIEKTVNDEAIVKSAQKNALITKLGLTAEEAKLLF